jgi:hypothetical protein
MTTTQAALAAAEAKLLEIWKRVPTKKTGEPEFRAVGFTDEEVGKLCQTVYLIRAARAESEWRGIESAPKDGTTILAWVAGEPRKIAYLADSHGREPGWYMASYQDWNMLFDIPQHWRNEFAPPPSEKGGA